MADIAFLQARFSASLLHATRAWRRQANGCLRAHGLSEATAWALVHASRLGDGIRQTTLAESLGIEEPSLVPLLHHLCATGLIRRQEDARDRRAKALHLTELGRETAGRVEAVLAALRREILKDVSAADLEASLRVFAAVEARVGRSLIPPAPVGTASTGENAA
jgi:MarR family transcriptional regulator, transcriptional regulator for hemolysin